MKRTPRHYAGTLEAPHRPSSHPAGEVLRVGHAKAAAEWRFACTVHNLPKAITTGHLIRQALAALA